jgi:hypothetical protein
VRRVREGRRPHAKAKRHRSATLSSFSSSSARLPLSPVCPPAMLLLPPRSQRRRNEWRERDRECGSVVFPHRLLYMAVISLIFCYVLIPVERILF